MQRVVNAKIKAGLKSSIMIWDLDIYCPKSHCSSHNTSLKIQIQDFKNFFHSEKSKPRNLKSALSHDNTAKLPKKDNKKDKKKRFWNEK